MGPKQQSVAFGRSLNQQRQQHVVPNPTSVRNHGDQHRVGPVYEQLVLVLPKTRGTVLVVVVVHYPVLGLEKPLVNITEHWLIPSLSLPPHPHLSSHSTRSSANHPIGMYVKRAGKWHCTRIVCGYTAARNLNFPRVQSGNITADYLQRDLAAGSGSGRGRAALTQHHGGNLSLPLP